MTTTSRPTLGAELREALRGARSILAKGTVGVITTATGVIPGARLLQERLGLEIADVVSKMTATGSTPASAMRCEVLRQRGEPIDRVVGPDDLDWGRVEDQSHRASATSRGRFPRGRQQGLVATMHAVEHAQRQRRRTNGQRRDLVERHRRVRLKSSCALDEDRARQEAAVHAARRCRAAPTGRGPGHGRSP